MAVENDGIQRRAGGDFKRGRAIVGRQNFVPVFTQQLNGISEAVGEVIQTQKRRHINLLN
jgi:hypothetical protein